MAITYLTTTRNALRAIKGSNKVSDIDDGIKALADDVDVKMASYSEGTFAARPAAGQPNRFYRALSSFPNVGLYHDTGSAWNPIPELPTGMTYSMVEEVGFGPVNPSSNRPCFCVMTINKPVAGAPNGGNVIVGGKLVAVFGTPETPAERLSTEVLSFITPPNQSIVVETGNLAACQPIKLAYIVL